MTRKKTWQITWFFDSLNSVVPDKENLHVLARRLGETTVNLKRMIDEFKNYGKPIKLKKELTDINEIISNEATYAKPPDFIKVHLDLDPQIPKFRLDVARFSENIKELMNNAIRVITDKKGHGIIIITTKLNFEKNVGIGTDRSVEILIEDNGPGFPPNFPFFMPFNSTDPQRTGLGLATVKEIVEAHGGSIEYIPRNCGGACFKIVLHFKEGTK